MKIITTSKFYYKKNDIERYMLNISDLLRNYRHEVVPFATKNKKNLKTVYDIFFAPQAKESNLKKNFLIKNTEVQKKLSLLINTIQPEILWNFGINEELMPHVLFEAKRKNLEVIQTISDDALVENPPSLLSKMIGKTTNNVSINKNLKYYSSHINTFIAPSQFLISKMMQEGIPKEKLVHIPAFISTKNIEPNYDSKEYFVYSDELSSKYGARFLIEAMTKLPQYKLVILGNGELKSELLATIEKQNLKNVSIIDSYTQELKSEIIKNARFTICPAQWYTNSPNSILESYASGTPVLASDIGGIKEYVASCYSGILFEHNNIDEMCEKINYLMQNPKITKEMGIFARSLAENCYNSEIHYYKVFNLLNSTIQTHREFSKIITNTKY